MASRERPGGGEWKAGQNSPWLACPAAGTQGTAMIPRIAAFIILWVALALLFAPFIGERLKGRAAELPPAPGDPSPDAVPAPGLDPPEWEPDDHQAQAIAETFAESAQEGPLFDPWEPTDGLR